MYTEKDVLGFVEDGDVKFIRLSFVDAFGSPRNISVMPEELPRVFSEGVSFDASAIRGFGGEVLSDLFLHPDPSTLSVLPWRPSRGRVARLICDIAHPDGTPFKGDTRRILRSVIDRAAQSAVAVNIGAEFEFYLFKTDENGQSTGIPFDHAGYMDMFPEDMGENLRREICLSLSEMGIHPESSHHEEGPGQHEIDFRFDAALQAADNAVTFKTVVRAVAMQSGLYADFSPKPLPGQAGNGLHVNLSLAGAPDAQKTDAFMAGLLFHIPALTAFLNPLEKSYLRFGSNKAPRYITWSPENRSQLIRIPAAKSERFHRIELRSPDPSANPYLAFALLIAAGLDGVKKGMLPPAPVNVNLFAAEPSFTRQLSALPATLPEAMALARESALVRSVVPSELMSVYEAAAR